MYTIQSLSIPHNICFSRNPVLYRFRVTPFTLGEVNDRLRVCVRVFMETYFGSEVYEEVWTGQEFPNSRGLATIDIQTILDAHLEFYTPDPNLKKFHRCKHQSKRFYLEYWYESDSGAFNDPRPTTGRVAIKGGLSNEEFHPSEFFVTNVGGNRKTLHFWHSEERIREDELKWLFFTVLDPTMEKLILNCELLDPYYNSITAYTPIEQGMSTSYGEVFAVPLSMVLLDVPSQVPGGVLLRALNFWVTDATAAEFTERIRLEVDLRPMYDVRYIYYRNSLGGLECQPFLGDKELSVAIASQRAELVKQADLLQLFNMQNEMPVHYSTQQPGTEGNTGWIPQKQLDKLRDLLLAKQVYEPYGRRLRPLVVNTDKTKLWRTTEKLYNLAVEFAVGFQDVNYTPEFTLAQGDTCPAVSVLVLSQEFGRFMHIHWELPPGYDKIKIDYTFDSNSYTAVYFGNIGDAEIQIFNNALPVPPKTVTVTAKVICNDEVAPFSYGPGTTAIINIEPSIPPVAVPDQVDEIPRIAGTSYILKQNGQELDFTANDIPLNGGYINGIISLYTAGGAVTTLSANGANLSVLSGDRIAYSHTGASLANMAQDYFYYRVRETVGLVNFSSNLVKILVPVKAQTPKIWVKYVRLSELTEGKPYGLLDNYTVTNITHTGCYVQFFADAACTIPFDATGLGLTIAWVLSTVTTDYNAVGNITSVTGSTGPLQTLLLVGTSMLLMASFKPANVVTANGSGATREVNKLIPQPAGTVGDIVYLNWP